jgi:hypothetical protein
MKVAGRRRRASNLQRCRYLAAVYSGCQHVLVVLRGNLAGDLECIHGTAFGISGYGQFDHLFYVSAQKKTRN